MRKKNNGADVRMKWKNGRENGRNESSKVMKK